MPFYVSIDSGKVYSKSESEEKKNETKKCYGVLAGSRIIC